MSETGGPTNESGILYQNSIAALFLGRMCDVARRPDQERVYSVRVEAPVDVDDVVVTFADSHRGYIQAKESIRVGHESWTKLWRDLDEQFRRPDFENGRDRLILYVGDAREEIRDLKEACLRAGGSMSFGEWQTSLSERQKALVEKIKPLLSPETLEDSTLLYFFKHIDVEIWSLVEIERDKLYNWIPPSDVGRSPIELFRLLRDRVGGEARRRGTFTADGLRESLANEGYRLAIPPDMDSLREAVRRCGASLLQHKHTIARTGRHIRRGEVDSILAWARGDLGVEPVAMLLDRAGMGKSVVIRDLLIGLEEAGIVTLAIKADRQLSGVDSHDSLQAALGLPEPVERVVGRLAALGPVVVLVDQIDALSLSLARDQKALDVVLEMVARLRLIPGVRILISCRAFDRNSDPRLRSIEVKREFALAELPEAEVDSVLRSVGVEFDRLSPATRKLLRVPLHLDLLTRAVEGQGTRPHDPEVYRGIGNLQALYALVWQFVILKPEPSAPPTHERLEVLGRMTDAMFKDQRTSVSQSIFATAEAARLEQAVLWLASQGILLSDSNEWSFLHQTFFDYCYARRFVESGRSLAGAILESDQGLNVRPLLVQVLSYHRAGDPRKYLAELRGLFASDGMRHHLRDLLLRWFGTLPEPTDGEWNLAYPRLLDPATRPSFLSAMVGNPGWFARIDGEPLESFLSLDDESVDSQVIPYPISMLGESQSDVVAIAGKLTDWGGTWTSRAARIVSMIRDWNLPEAAEVFERLASALEDFLPSQSYQLDNVAKNHPRIGCCLIRRLLDRLLEDFVAKRQQMPAVYHSSLSHELDQLNSGMVIEAMKVVSESEPGYFSETLIPWLENAIKHSGWPGGREEFYGYDDLCHGWHDGVYVVRFGLIRAFVSALVSYARLDIEGFRQLASVLAAIPYQTPQLLLAQVYQAEPGLLASGALDFLLADRRRLYLGESDRYESRKVIAAIFPILSSVDRARLESFILDNPRPWQSHGLDGLRWRGLDQLHLLQAIPADDLTDRGRSYLGELERRFPGVEASEDPRTMFGGWVGSPIPGEAIPKMSDRDWLSAMKRYRPGVASWEPLKGGHRELGGALLTAVKDAPERFYCLVGTMSDEDVGPYAWAIVNGIAESSAPSEWHFDLVRRFALHPDSEGRQAIAWTLKKRMESGLPDDLMDLLEGWCRDVTLDRKGESASDPDSGYLNSDRGAALGTLMGALDQRGSVETRDRKWRLIEFVATDPSTTLRAGAVEGLLHLLRENRERAVSRVRPRIDVALVQIPSLKLRRESPIDRPSPRTDPIGLVYSLTPAGSAPPPLHPRSTSSQSRTTAA